jgi:hypothetical protein
VLRSGVDLQSLCSPQPKNAPNQQYMVEELSESSELTICALSIIITGDDPDAWNMAMPRGLLFVPV